MEADMNLFSKNNLKWNEHYKFKKMIERIENNNLEIKYIDNTSYSPVISGQIEKQKGWYIKEYGKNNDSKVHVNAKIFEKIENLFLFLGQD
jgi:hypothetical protein